jgi:hypothetical protein
MLILNNSSFKHKIKKNNMFNSILQYTTEALWGRETRVDHPFGFKQIKISFGKE